jgi:hypothetical protein
LNIKQQDLQNQLLNIKTDAATATANRTAANKRAQNSIKAQAQRAATSSATARRGQDLSHADRVRGQDVASADRAKALQAKGDPAKKPEAADVRRTRQAVNSISTEIKGLANGRSRTRVGEIMRARAAKAGQRLPEDLLSAALDLGVDGHISPRNVKMLKEVYGVAVPASWRRRPRSTRAGLVAAAQGSGVRPLTPVPII